MGRANLSWLQTISLVRYFNSWTAMAIYRGEEATPVRLVLQKYKEYSDVRGGLRAQFTDEPVLHCSKTFEMFEPIGMLDNCPGVCWSGGSQKLMLVS
jgi:hypothetical protein